MARIKKSTGARVTGAAKRSRATPRASAARKAGNPGVSEEERRRMIAEAAYYRALRRNFQGGDPVKDWFEAEREVDRLLPGPEQKKRELAAYERLRDEIGKRLGEVRETLNAETMRQALHSARERLKEAGEHTADTVDKVAASIEKDIVNAAHRMGPKWEAFSEKTADLFGVWRDRSATFLGRAAQGVVEWLHQAGRQLGPRTYRTGEIAAAGTFACTACGHEVQLKTAAHLPPCPSCLKTEFKRI
jgi:rubrerythrin